VDAEKLVTPVIKECLICGLQSTDNIVVCPEDGSALISVKPDPYVGTSIADRFDIVSLIGSGGMGNVYKARQHSMDRFVAIKILHTDRTTKPTGLRRFQQEAKTASNLSHPNIVNVFDFGVLPDNVPYLVMEYVEGQSLYDVLQSGPLSIDRTIHIFTQACDALAHAHQKGVVHRDIKPSNIMLVKTDTKSDVVKVLDFGIAKILTPHDESVPSITVTGEVFGSPHYMSPEQCTGKPFDERSDIYSLGCVIYEAITGRPPVSGDNVLETIFKHSSDTPQAFSKVRPEVVIPQQLEAIVFKALEKSPENRFQSMAAFKRNLEFATSFPDEKQAPPPAKKTTLTDLKLPKVKPPMKVLLGLGAVGLVAAALIGLDETIGKHTASTKFAEMQLSWKEQTHGKESPQVVAAMHDLGKRYYDNKQFGKAIDLHEKWLRLTRKLKGDNSVHAALAEEEVGDLYKNLHNLKAKSSFQNAAEILKANIRTNVAANKYADNQPLLEQMLRLQMKLHGHQHPEVATTYLQMAENSTKAGNSEKADPLYDEAIKMRTSIFGGESTHVADAIAARAVNYVALGNYKNAEVLYKQALEIKSKILGPQSTAVGDLSESLAGMYQKEGKFEAAETAYLDALAIQKAAAPGDNERVANVLDSLASLYAEKSENKKSEEMYRLAVSTKERLASSPDAIIKSLIGLGNALKAQSEFTKAEESFERALDLLPHSTSTKASRIAILQALAESYKAQGKEMEAKVYAERLANERKQQ
jgi:eukaryotic-like serine/threonine-protein kinase